MEPYWKYTYNNVDGIGEQSISLFKYSEKCIALKCSQEFGRGFSKNLKTVGGRFNMNLRFSEVPEPGWIFKLESQENLQKFISSVQKKEITPRAVDQTSEKQENISLFRKLKELVDLIPEEGDDFIISETNGFRTYITFDDDENSVYSVKSSKKIMNVCQVRI
jgi:hypothetical protein